MFVYLMFFGPLGGFYFVGVSRKPGSQHRGMCRPLVVANSNYTVTERVHVH